MRSTGPPRVARARAGLRLALPAALALALCAAGCARLPLPGFLERATRAALQSEPTVPYRVKAGDTVERVAAWHGVDADALRRANGLERGEQPAAGTVLQVPERPLATYVLRPGDTLGRVAQWYGVDVDALIRLNGVTDVRRLPVGMEVRIPATATRDGARLAARAHASRTATRRAATPAVSAAPPRAAAATSTGAVASPGPTEATAPAEVDRALAEATEAYDAADFEGALAAARRAEQRLNGAVDPADRARLARAHLLAGMAAVALGRDDDARCSFQAAVALDESVAPDPLRASPRILTVFNAAQGR